MLKNNEKPIINIIGSGRPRVCVMGAVHGDEIVGKWVVDDLNKLKISKGTLVTVMANPVALHKKVRFVDSDLNRCFPGSSKGDLEERLAHELLKTIKKCDVVMDIHTTQTDLAETVIIKKNTKRVREIIKMIKPKNIILMPRKVGPGALTNFNPVGLSLEYGRHGSQLAKKRTTKALENVLAGLGMTEKKLNSASQVKTNFYKVYDEFYKKASFKVNSKIKNMVKVKKGDEIGKLEGKSISAPREFYPVLFSQTGYNHIYGFKATKVKSL